LSNATKVSNGYSLTIQNIGGMAAPFDVVLTFADGSTERIHQTPFVCLKDQKLTKVNVTAKIAVQSIKLDGGIFMDANEADNVWKAKSF
jgi:hypothetical protein